jgi:hypothetical protein
MMAMLLLASTSSNAAILRVPSQFPTIQAAINASQNGDTVLVSSGRYLENIRYRGKRITVASEFLTTGNRNFILSTIIDGSQPSVPDSASTVRIIDGEDSTTVLAGFTITGGRGTRWQDEHTPGIYREGGGILCSFNSPVIRDNLIIGNSATDATGSSGAGGGGMRLGDGNVTLINNIIMQNTARDYGGGIVMNYCACTMRNNIIAMNSMGTNTLGGGGMWINRDAYGAFAGRIRIIENNTFIGNSSGSNGGGVKFFAGITAMKNCVFWANTAPSGSQFTGAATFTYSNIQFASGGTNFALAPQFADSGFYLLPSSPNVDAGDTAMMFNDLPNTANPLQALLPSLGGRRNDIGSYGGAQTRFLLPIRHVRISAPTVATFPNTPQGGTARVSVSLINQGAGRLRVDSVAFQLRNPGLSAATTFPLLIAPAGSDSISLQWTNPNPATLNDTLLIYHRDTSRANPWKVRLSGTIFSGVAGQLSAVPKAFQLMQNFPNPFNPSTVITYQLPITSNVKLEVFDLLGRKVVTLVDERQPPGSYRALFNTAAFSGGSAGLSSGVYFYRLAARSATTSFTETKRFTLLK